MYSPTPPTENMDMEEYSRLLRKYWLGDTTVPISDKDKQELDNYKAQGLMLELPFEWPG
jgi:hypothetical protein